MKAIIVCCFDTYIERVDLLKQYYKSKGYDTYVIISNFKHFKKEFIKEKKDKYIYINTKPYYKNLSVQRLYSHYKFSNDAFKLVSKINPNLIHVLVPANSLVKKASQYKKKNDECKIIIDLIDLWPETMPIGKMKNYFPFTIWRNLRDKNLDNIDTIFTECNLYKDILNKKNDSKYKVLYWAKDDVEINIHENAMVDNNAFDLCYLGSINNIIDIDYIVKICKSLNNFKQTNLHLIGDGEKKEELIQKMNVIKVPVIDYGTIYDNRKKQQIFNKCHFGLNIMKSSVCVGLTMKSLDYFRAGLPIINNIKGDTFDLVNKYRIGFNDFHDLINQKKYDEQLYLDMRNNVKEMYKTLFSREAFMNRINQLEED